LGIPTERLDSIKEQGLNALPEIDKTCWEAFLATDPPACDLDLSLGGRFFGVGWFDQDNDAVSRVSARWMGGARVASVFVRVIPGYRYRLCVTAHHLRSGEMAEGLSLSVGEQSLQVQRSRHEDGITLVTADLPDEIIRNHGGRLWLRVGYSDSHGHEGWASFSRIEAIRFDPESMSRVFV
jgi:hypothetical protein